MKNLYEILDIAQNASKKDIHTAYWEQARMHHPDKGGDAEKMKEINAAYQVLTDPVQRQVLDEQLTFLNEFDEVSTVHISGALGATSNSPYSTPYRAKHAAYRAQYTQQPLWPHKLPPYTETRNRLYHEDQDLSLFEYLHALKKSTADTCIPKLWTPEQAQAGC